jgi:hypothetical protein
MDDAVLRMERRSDSYVRWVECMRAGSFEAAWKISDAALRWAGSEYNNYQPLHRRIVWDGRSLVGKRILVRCFHGLGDTIQFIRYLPLLAKVAAEITIALPPSLVELFAGASGLAGVRMLSGTDAEWCANAEIEVMELAHLFRTTEETIPPIPNMDVEPAAQNGKFSVGLVWRAGTWDDRRSVAIQELCQLQALQNISLFSLQLDPYAAGWRNEFGTALDARGVLRTARLISALDLIITVDTMAAHLAGTLRKPVWTLLHTDADWRWMRGRRDSPWYPTMRLFRQREQGNWGPAITEVVNALERMSCLQARIHATTFREPLSHLPQPFS